MKMRKKALSIMVSAVLAAGLCPLPAFAQGGEALSAAASSLKAQAGDLVASGTWGTCPWELDADGNLTVHPGVGADAEVDPNEDADDRDDWYTRSPWRAYAERVSSIAFAAEGGEKVVAPARSSSLFRGLSNLKSVDLSGLDTSNATTMGYMFWGCSSLESLNLSGFSTSKVRNMEDMFSYCSSLEFLNLSGFDTSMVEEGFDGMFSGCTSLARVAVGASFTATLPSYEVSGHTDWFSEGAGAWFTAEQIASGRAGVADTYVKSQPVKSIAGASVTVAAQVYTGQPLTPVPTVELGGKALVEGSDFTVAYKDNVNAGTAAVTVTGKGNYAGTLESTFEIAKATIAVPKAAGLVYNGKAQTGVAAGEGYSVAGNTATDAGSYTATLTADANHAFAGGKSTASVSWSISKATLATPGAKAGLKYTGQRLEGVAAGAGYSIEGNMATDAGSYTATLTADKNHVFADGKAIATVRWSIAKATLSAPKAKAGLVYSGRTLTGIASGEGYSVKDNTAKNAGAYTAILTADKNHVFADGKASATVMWSIAKASQKISAKNAKATAEAKKSGKAKALAKNVTVNLKKKAKVSAKTKVTYKKANKAGGKLIAVNAKTGKVTLKKGLKAGTYKVKVELTAAAGKNYKAAKAKYVTLTVKVK